MKISIGTDHRGVEIKSNLKTHLEALGHEVTDCGTHTTEACDYPDIAHNVSMNVSKGISDRGILICNSGIGMAITANKIKGIRAALCHHKVSAELSRQHNDANVLVLASSEVGDRMKEVVDAWLLAEFEGGRHQRRVDKISQIEDSDS